MFRWVIVLFKIPCSLKTSWTYMHPHHKIIQHLSRCLLQIEHQSAKRRWSVDFRSKEKHNPNVQSVRTMFFKRLKCNSTLRLAFNLVCMREICWIIYWLGKTRGWQDMAKRRRWDDGFDRGFMYSYCEKGGTFIKQDSLGFHMV